MPSALRPIKHLGQNFLQNPEIIQRIIKTIHPLPGDTIIEIGPGQGALTAPLLDAGAVVHAIEIDRRLTHVLRKKLAGQKKFILYEKDALKFDFHEIKSTSGSLRIVGNLPYYISTPLLFHLLHSDIKIQDMYLMLQKEVADRLGAQPGKRSYGRLTVMAKLYCAAIHPLFDIEPESFHPVPKVFSTMVQFLPHPVPPCMIRQKQLDRVLRLTFQQRRKTLRRTLKGVIGEEELTAAGIDAGLRPEQIGIEDFLRISTLLPEACE